MALDFFTKRKIRKEAKQLEQEIQVEDRPDLRLRLAGLYRKLDRDDEAKTQYRIVTQAYLDQGKRGQAEAVCRSVLEFYPKIQEFQDLFATITGKSFGAPEPVTTVAMSEPSAEEDVGQMMNHWSEPEDPTPIADYNQIKMDTWQDESDPGARRIPSPPAGVPRIAATLSETITHRFPSRDERLSSIANEIRTNRNETIDVFKDQDEDMFSAAWEDEATDDKTPDRFAEADELEAEVEEDFWTLAPLLRELDEDSREALRRQVSTATYEPGTVLFHEGDAGNSLFLIIDGEVRVSKLQPSGEEREISLLNAGEFFGEFALLTDQKRHASITTVVRTTVLEISKKTVQEIGKKHPAILEVIKKFYRSRLQDLMIKNLTFFNLISAEKRAQYLTDIHFHRFAAGTSIIKQGSKGGGFFLILLGEVEVVVEAEGETDGKEAVPEKVLSVLGEGEYFGEMALLKRKPAMASVRSRTFVEIVQIPAKIFFQILADHPPIWRQMQEEVEKRQLLNHYYISGRSSQMISY
ncbi:MAG: hypothetical protein CVU59_07440 [Deltaproteobacteria bacterium HGW-Deltaproteobacteria-17]|nr:MAG: hypothetical protein CVU59_07440 [Deltaproteobacteria bacterium HGW-Deltaproteobacteria-17]